MITEEDVTKMDPAAESLRNLNDQKLIAVGRCADPEASPGDKMLRLKEAGDGMTFA